MIKYLSTAILFRAVLSRTTTASALRASRLRVSRELYGCTTTSGELSQLGKTEYVCKYDKSSVRMAIFGTRAHRRVPCTRHSLHASAIMASHWQA